MQSTIAIVGRGRLGPALASALDAAGRRVLGPFGRGADGGGADVVLLCVPDAAFAGAGCAIGGSTLRALHVAESLAVAVGMRPFPVADDDRAAYHAAASIASNFVVTIEAAAERVAATAGVPRAALVPLVRAAVENWAALGAEEALTGPIARGDDAVVARQRMAIAARAPELLGLFDALTEATRALARGEDPGAPANGTEVGP